jgi:glycolate oxidase FAD binding subunit
MRYGGCRDRVLGLRVALPSGHLISVGGKTVKNVSGYDLPKLFVGSLGTLGVITAATFKLLPLPERTEWSGWAFDDLAAAARCANQLAASQLELSAIELVSGELAGRPRAWLLFCRAQGMSSAVERQMQGVAQACEDAGGYMCKDAQSGAAMLHTLSLLCWIAVPPASLTGILTQARRLFGAKGSFTASPAMGTAHIAFDGDDAAAVIADLRRAAETLGGSLVIARAPVEVKLAAGVWGAAPDGVEIMRALKTEFDPKGVLSPGRFVGGI